MAELNVICMRWGTAFGPEYVNRLFGGISRFSQRDVRFFCMTDDRTDLNRDIEVLDLVEEPFHEEMMAVLPKTRVNGAMRKVSMFRPGLIPDLKGALLALDLDIVITGNVDDLADYAPGKICMRRSWKPGRWPGVGHGSVLKFEPEAHSYLYEAIAANPRAEIMKAEGSEQGYTSTKANEAGDFEPFPDAWIINFKRHCRPRKPLNLILPPTLPRDARVVCFPGTPKIEEAIQGYRGSLLHWIWPAKWLKDYWRD